MTVSTVSFDMNGTITQGGFVDLVWHEGVPALYARTRGLPLDAARRIVHQEYDEVGEQRTDWYDIRYWFRRFRLGEDWTGLLLSYRDQVAPYPEAAEVLERLSRSYRLVVTSNASRDFMDIELAAAGLDRYFTDLFSCTSDLGEVKKTPEVYARVCRALSVSPREMAHVGDHELFDFAAPSQLGIRAFHLDRTAASGGGFVVRDLREFMARIGADDQRWGHHRLH